jgi:hypothetical protein
MHKQWLDSNQLDRPRSVCTILLEQCAPWEGMGMAGKREASNPADLACRMQ